MRTPSRREFLKTPALVAGAAIAASGRAAAAQTGDARRLTLACADYVRLMPIATGDVRPPEITLTWLRGDRSEMLRRALGDPQVDGGETSMAQHVMRVDRGDRSHVAIPAFPLRNFTVRDLYVRKGSTLTPQDLGGRRIGIYNWAASGAVWYRHLIRYFGHDPAAISWIVGSPDSPSPVAVNVPLPPNVSLATPGRSLSELLLAGGIDVFFAPLPPSAYHPVDGAIARLVPDFRPVEQRYFRETGCYPPQHVVVLRRATWERDRSLGARLVALFDECERRFHDAQRLFPYASPWLMAEIEDTEQLMTASYHAHGLERNRHALDVFCRTAFDDGLTKRRVTVDEFFAEFRDAG